MKKITRKQKIKMNPEGSGNSRYAKKVARRTKLAKSLDLPADTPYPLIWITQRL